MSQVKSRLSLMMDHWISIFHQAIITINCESERKQEREIARVRRGVAVGGGSKQKEVEVEIEYY